MNDKEFSLNISDLSFLFFIFIIAQFILINLFHFLNNMIKLPIKNASIIYALASTPLIFILMIIWIKHYKNIKLLTTIQSSNISSLKIISLLITTSGLNIILSELNNITHNFFPLAKELISKLNQIVFTNSTNLIFTFLVITIINVIIKELLLRGLLLRGLHNNYQAEWSILIVAAFQLLINFSLHNFLTTLTISILLSWLYIKTKSILDCIIASLFFNLIPYLLIYFTPIKIQGFNTKFSTIIHFQPFWFNLLGIILFFSGSWLLLKQINSEKITF